MSHIEPSNKYTQNSSKWELNSITKEYDALRWCVVRGAVSAMEKYDSFRLPRNEMFTFTADKCLMTYYTHKINYTPSYLEVDACLDLTGCAKVNMKSLLNKLWVNAPLT